MQRPPAASLAVAGMPGGLVWAALVAAFVAIALVIAWPAIDGDFLSDDFLYIVNNPYVHGLSLENLRVLLDPYGPPTVYTLNWAPVHLLLHAVEYELWGEETRGYHVANAVAHALTAALLVAFFLRSRLPAAAALLAALLFLVHPANVETVAWIFQLKTIAALALAVAALLLHARHPGWAVVCFGLAILTKISAIAALPTLVVQAWVRGGEDGEPPRWGFVAVWLLLVLLVSVPEMAAFQRQSDVRIVIHEDPVVHARTIVAIAMRYMAMAGTSWGVATFHEPDAAESLLDPWWLGGVAVLALLGWRLVRAIVRREEEAIHWMFAAASFAPISQIFPFIFPMGDRYLYPILPGLFGGALLALRGPWSRICAVAAERLDDRTLPVNMNRLLLAAALCTAMAFAIRSTERAPVFQNGMTMMMDAALRYPQGMQASLLRGHQAARTGNAGAAAAAFQQAVDLGFSDLGSLLNHPELATLRGDRRFQSVLLDLAERDIARLSPMEDPDQSELMRLGLAYSLHDDPQRAESAYVRAIELEGPFAEQIRNELAALRAAHPQLGKGP